MSKFKVGDRVRILIGENTGAEGVIVRPWPHPECARVNDKRAGESWNVSVASDPGPHLRFFSDELAPILPPAADEWATDKVSQVCKPTYLEPAAPVGIELDCEQ